MMHHYSNSQRIAFVSDVHLQDQDDPNVDRLTQCLQALAGTSDAIYILGDLFDFWMTADCASTHQKVLSAIQHLSKQCPVFFMPGNRDFFMTQSVCRTYGMTKIADPLMIYHGEKKVLLTHGDLLCSKDRTYQIMRFILQSRLVRGLHAIIPAQLITYLTRKIQAACHRSKKQKPAQCMQADTHTIQSWFQRYQPDILIFGHVHKPQHYCIDDDCIHGEVVVLDSWENQANFCQITEAGLSVCLSE